MEINKTIMTRAEIQSARGLISNSKQIDKLLKRFNTTAENVDSKVVELLGSGILLDSSSKKFKVYPPIFLIMVGFGVADKFERGIYDGVEKGIHNGLLIEFLESVGAQKIVDAYKLFWESPQTAKVQYVPETVTYKAMNQFNFKHLLKIKGRAPKLVVLPDECGESVELISIDISTIDWDSLFCAFRNV